MLAALTAASDGGGGASKIRFHIGQVQAGFCDYFGSAVEMNNSMESPIIPQEDLTNIHLHT